MVHIRAGQQLGQEDLCPARDVDNRGLRARWQQVGRHLRRGSALSDLQRHRRGDLAGNARVISAILRGQIPAPWLRSEQTLVSILI